jgi:hypothetical protein
VSHQTQMACGECGVTYSMPTVLYDARRQDGQTFYCPNGHGRVFRETADQATIKGLRRELGSWKEHADYLSGELVEINQLRHGLVNAVKQCPGCDWRSHRQVGRDPGAQERGLARVRRDVAEHLRDVHGARAQGPLQLLERV